MNLTIICLVSFLFGLDNTKRKIYYKHSKYCKYYWRGRTTLIATLSLIFLILWRLICVLVWGVKVIFLMIMVVFSFALPLLVWLLLVWVIEWIIVVFWFSSLIWWIFLIVISWLICGYSCSSWVIMFFDFCVRKNVVSFCNLLKFFSHLLSLSSSIRMV